MNDPITMQDSGIEALVIASMNWCIFGDLFVGRMLMYILSFIAVFKMVGWPSKIDETCTDSHSRCQVVRNQSLFLYDCLIIVEYDKV